MGKIETKDKPTFAIMLILQYTIFDKNVYQNNPFIM